MRGWKKGMLCFAVVVLLLAGCGGEKPNGSETGQGGQLPFASAQDGAEGGAKPGAQEAESGAKPGAQEAEGGTKPGAQGGGSKKDRKQYVWNQSMGKYDDYPEDYFVKWALPGSEFTANDISGATMEAVNAKLEADEYPFGLKIVLYDGGDLVEPDVEELLKAMRESGADIVTLSTGNRKAGEAALDAGLFEPLEERLEGSRLYDMIPRLCWECVRYGGISYIPSESLSDCGPCIYIRRELLPEDFPEQFDGDLFKLGDYLSEDVRMQYEESGYEFAQAFGYVYDRGLLVAEDGSCIDPLEDERVVEWLRTVNRWYHEGKVELFPGDGKNCAIVFNSYPWEKEQMGDYQEYYFWKGTARHRMAGSVGILAASGKKDAAFTLLELLHTDTDYAELLVYGKEAPEQGEQTGGSGYAKWMFGLDTGLRRDGNWGLDFFSNAEEKKQYYEDHVIASPTLYTDFPGECEELGEIAMKHMMTKNNGSRIIPNTSLLSSDDFDAWLKKYRDEAREPMEKVLRKLAEQK